MTVKYLATYLHVYVLEICTYRKSALTVTIPQKEEVRLTFFPPAILTTQTADWTFLGMSTSKGHFLKDPASH